MKLILKKINSIEKKEYEGEVFDLTVENSHSYNINGTVVHNSACYTRSNTGTGVPQLSSLEQIRLACPNLPIIADGGIKETGAMVKALKFADAVMVGSYVSGTSETPGHVYQNEKGEQYKIYRGSASAENKVQTGGENSFVEGKMITVPFKGKVKYYLRRAKQGIQSGFSYSGAFNLKEFREKAKFVFLSGGAKSESKL